MGKPVQASRCNPAQTDQAIRRQSIGKRPEFAELHPVADAVLSIACLALFMLAACALFVMVGAGL